MVTVKIIKLWEESSYCWAPIVNGKVVEHKGRPPMTVRAAKKAASKILNQPQDSINFLVDRG
jgi:hypothetical protein